MPDVAGTRNSHQSQSAQRRKNRSKKGSLTICHHQKKERTKEKAQRHSASSSVMQPPEENEDQKTGCRQKKCGQRFRGPIVGHRGHRKQRIDQRNQCDDPSIQIRKAFPCAILLKKHRPAGKHQTAQRIKMNPSGMNAPGDPLSIKIINAIA